ncbi:het domain-containing protein [Rutstroemia sp. NJR-2017a BBW]|nr:het domain-containing protein [Rutstroemia sp. NJR-2017a BBW]
MAGRAVPPYVALSYCWGDGIQGGVCTTANLSTLLEGMALCELPLTIRDAVQVAIASGINWVWVDRLCIVQDDPQDLEVELRNMAGIYANASPVLSAACAQNSEDGFLSTREAPQNFLLPFDIAGDEPGHVLLHEQYSFADRSISFIDQRAWTFQEHAMAPRLLRFGEVQTEWRCTEAHLFDEPAYSKTSSFYQKTR